jgi:hypothetical protein
MRIVFGSQYQTCGSQSADYTTSSHGAVAVEDEDEDEDEDEADVFNK